MKNMLVNGALRIWEKQKINNLPNHLTGRGKVHVEKFDPASVALDDRKSIHQVHNEQIGVLQKIDNSQKRFRDILKIQREIKTYH